MLADYVSTSYVRGRPVSVFVLAVAARERPRSGRRSSPTASELTGLRVGILTGGGDCPGLNAVIRAVVRRSVQPRAARSSACMNGWQGLIDDNVLGTRPARGFRDPAPRRNDPRNVADESVPRRRRRRQRAAELRGRAPRRARRGRGRRHPGRRAVALGRARPARGRGAEDDRQRSLGDGLHVRLRHRSRRLHGGHRPPAHDSRVAQPRDGRGGDGAATRGGSP